MALLHEKEDDHNHKDKRITRRRGQVYSLEPGETHPIGEFVIVAKFNGRVLCHLASRLACVIRQGGRKGGRLKT